MLTIGDRWFINGNSFSASFADWVVRIIPHIICTDDPLESSMMSVPDQITESKWIVKFGQGDRGEWAHPIYCDTLEKAFELIDIYKNQIKYEDLMKKLIEDNR